MPAKVKMPAAIDELCFGAAGRFMVLGFERLGKVALFDVSEGKIVGYVPTEGHGLLFAAGAEKLVVYDPQTAMIQRYALDGLKPEDAQPIHLQQKIDRLAMGASSQGPLFYSTSAYLEGDVGVIDLTTLKPLECKLSPNVAGKMRGHLELRGSADGRTFGCWEPLTIPSGLFVLHFANEKLDGTYQRVSPTYVCPDDFGEHVYTDLGIYDNRAKQNDPNASSSAARISYLPAVGGPAYLTYPCEMKSRSPAHGLPRGPLLQRRRGTRPRPPPQSINKDIRTRWQRSRSKASRTWWSPISKSGTD